LIARLSLPFPLLIPGEPHITDQLWLAAGLSSNLAIQKFRAAFMRSSCPHHLKEPLMRATSSKTLAFLLAVSASLGLAMTSASPALAASSVQALDPDHDGTVDLAEAKAAAGALFDKLEKDKDSTLDRKELGDRISEPDWAAANPDHDKTISKDEYLAYVDALFKKADADHDGTLDAKELKTPAGHALLRLLK
jgi:Ca2+-binding EF-hand superfamily protein